MRVFISETTFSHRAVACAFSARAVDSRRAFRASPTTWRQSGEPPGCPESPGLTLKLWLGQTNGQHGGQAREHVVLLTLSLPPCTCGRCRPDACASRAQALLKARGVGTALGVAIMFTKFANRGLVADAPAQGNVHLAITFHISQLRAAVLPSSTGTVSVKVPLPLNARCR